MRIVRKTNDGVTIAALIGSILFVGLSGMAIAMADERFIQIFVFFLASVVAAGSLVLIFRIVRPRELELIIDSTRIRFGDPAQPCNQKSIPRKSVHCVVFDRDDASLFIVTGRWVASPLAPEIVIRRSQMQLVAEYISENWEGVPVVGQFEFQKMCRARKAQYESGML